MIHPDETPLLSNHQVLVILNNGVEFAATYFIMLASLLFTGAGRYVSVDYWVKRTCKMQERWDEQ